MKALYRRGVSHAELNNYEDALTDLNNVLDLEPTNKAATQRLKVTCVHFNMSLYLVYNTPMLGNSQLVKIINFVISRKLKLIARKLIC